MSKKIENENIEEKAEKAVDATEDVVKETKPKMEWLKKNGKKLAKGAAVVGGVLVAYALGKGSSNKSGSTHSDPAVTFDEADVNEEI